jgi:hypothetical protein
MLVWLDYFLSYNISLLSKVPSPAIVTMAALSQWERVLGVKRKAGEGEHQNHF